MMYEPEELELLRAARDAIRRDDKAEGQRLLLEDLRANPRSETAWLWLSAIVDDPARERYCLERVLMINPDNEVAKRHVARLDQAQIAERQSAAQAGPAAVIRCPHCGNIVKGSAKFCTQCGGNVEAAPESRVSESMVSGGVVAEARLDVPPKAPISESKVSDQDTVEATLEVARLELLDMSLYNRLLNYQTLKSKGVEVVGTEPEQVYDVLVRQSRSVSFLSVPEGTDQRPLSEERSSERPESDGDVENDIGQPDENEEELQTPRRDNRLQTPYTSAQLQRRLLNTYHAARTYIEEQGVNVLFLALGMLNWLESRSSQIVRKAPLVLLPVELSRTSARARFSIRYTEDEIEGNLSLRAKLQSEFGISLPEPLDGDELDISEYLRQVSEAVQHMQGWSVDSVCVVLGFFSFGKFLMFSDLNPQVWPDDAKPSAHPVLQALLGRGFSEPEAQVSDDAWIDDHVPPGQLHQVVDADSSQTLAILDVANGRNLTIQGPPGTGKSQTITNLVAEAIASNKTVLFVSEKMAALEVVKRRLDAVGLGEACLELHSQKTSKRAVLDELRRSLELGQPKQEGQADAGVLAETRSRLNQYSTAVNTVVGTSGITPYEAFGRLLLLDQRLGNVDAPRIDSHALKEYSGPDFRKRLEDVERLQQLIAGMGVPREHPFWGSSLRAMPPVEEELLSEESGTAYRSAVSIQRASSRLAQLLGLPVPRAVSQVAGMLDLARHALASPGLEGVEVGARDWLTESDVLADTLRAGSKSSTLHGRYGRLLSDTAWDADVGGLAESYAEYRTKWSRFLSGDYRRARQAFVSLCREDPPRSLDSQLSVLDAIQEEQKHRRVVAEHESWLQGLFGPHWRGQDSDWVKLLAVADWLGDLHKRVESGSFPEQILGFLASDPDLEALEAQTRSVESELDAHREAVRAVVERLKLDEQLRFGENGALLGSSLEHQAAVLHDWQEQASRIQEMIVYNHLSDRLVSHSLESVLSVATSWPEAGQYLVEVCEKSWYDGLIEQAMLERPVLATFHSETHNHTIMRFRELDIQSLNRNRAILAYEHWKTLPKYTAGGQLGLLRREFAKKRRHLSIRKLISQAGNAIQAIKPVFMMSPLSIAMFLPPGSLRFDLVIFDEASQVKPVDAFGAILRAEKLVVVGDTRQLPPTAFFESVIDTDDDESEYLTSDLESILDLCYAQGVPARMLRWHYRSQHESLIAVSNHEFYDDRLVVFPSPDLGREELGLVYHHLAGTVYDRGKSRANVGEAREVAQAVMRHARAKPDQSLGVAAFSVSQMRAIQDQLEILRRQDESTEPFFRSHPYEPFFVKNLENVQGDERDVIYISVGYGRTAEGQISMNFGPLNREGGERRLNVLITRARKRCEVFTNLTADDIDLRRTNARGVAALKRYLSYAQTGRLDLPTATQAEPESPFEEAVAAELRRLGCQVECQVGVAGFSIDLAIIDDDRPGRYLLGIECDGASYHSAQSARDRDRLRQEVLESLGWTIHRVWSTDWFRNPDRELRRVMQSVEAARVRNAVDAGNSVVVSSPEPIDSDPPVERIDAPKDDTTTFSIQEYEQAVLQLPPVIGELHRVARHHLAQWVHQVVEIESPVHYEEVARRIADAAGVGRIGRRIRAALHYAAQYAIQEGTVRDRGQFLWAADMKRAVPRSRSNLPAPSRRIEYIAPEEISQVVKGVVSASFGMRREDIVPETCHLFGFTRVSSDMRAYVATVIDGMVEHGCLVPQGDHLIIASG